MDAAASMSESVLSGDGIDVSIVMPCLNEAAALAGCIARASAALGVLSERHGLTGEIVVADNSSTDRSVEIARENGARVEVVEVRGYGAALIGGFGAARGRYLVMGDADGSYDFLEAVAMIEQLMQGADLCIGSRFRGTIKTGAMPWLNRYIGNPLLSATLRILFRSKVSDAHCGLRALTKEAFNKLRLRSSGMEFASEMVLKASLTGMKVAEVPVTLSPDVDGRIPHLRPWRDGWRHLRYMLMLSPMWLFMAPALVFGAVGITIFCLLLANPKAEIVRIGEFAFGDHSLIVASSMITASHQMLMFAGVALIYGIRQGYRRPGPILRWTLRWARLEHFLLFSLLCGGLALLALGDVIWSWFETGFGPLNKLRYVVGAMMIGLIALQTFFGGFLISIAAGNEARFNDTGSSDRA